VCVLPPGVFWAVLIDRFLALIHRLVVVSALFASMESAS